MQKKRKKTFVTSFMQPIIEKVSRNSYSAKRKFVEINVERLKVMDQLVQRGKRVVLVVPKDASVAEKRFVERAKKIVGPGKLRIMTVPYTSLYEGSWQRDNFTRLNRRYYNRVNAQDKRRSLGVTHRFFGEGGRVVKAGIINGKKVLLVSESVLGKGTLKDPNLAKVVAEEMDMLRRQGYEVFSLPGYWFRAEGLKRGESAKREFFEHLDVFINAIPEKKVLLVDPEYLSANKERISQINKFLKYNIIEVPQSEKFYYPANLLSIGGGEVIVNSGAKKTIELLRKAGVKVFATPKEIKQNLEYRGSVGCFVNVD